jgi:hypothetical protein
MALFTPELVRRIVLSTRDFTCRMEAAMIKILNKHLSMNLN